MLADLLAVFQGLKILRHAEARKELEAAIARRRLIRKLRDATPGARIGFGVCCIGWREDLFEAGVGVRIADGTVLAFGDQSNGYGWIKVGARTWIGQYNNLRAGGGNIDIGEDCLISQFCSLVGSNHACAKGDTIQSQGADKTRTGVVIGNDVWLGAGCAVMPGVCIADGAIIGANAVVTRNVSAGEIWAGVPARKIGVRE